MAGIMPSRKCAQCGAKSDPSTMKIAGLKAFCNIDCMVEFGKGNIDKGRKKLAKEKSKKFSEIKRNFKLNDKSLRKKEAQKAFNAFIRERDKNEPCISCGRHHTGQYHAGHYKSAGGNPEIRFEPLNCHKQCSVCNNHLSGNLVNYRVNLIDKIGLEKVEWLEGPHEPQKYTCEDLLKIEQEYKKKLKELKSGS